MSYYLLLYLWCTVHKLMIPELELGVLDKLNEGDEEPPGVRSVHYQSLQQNPATQSYISPHKYVSPINFITLIFQSKMQLIPHSAVQNFHILFNILY